MKAVGCSRYGTQDFRYVAEEDVYICPAGERLVYHFTNVEAGRTLPCYWTNLCQECAIKHLCTTGKERRIARFTQGLQIRGKSLFIK